ncbi:hypothetical protein [Marinobacter sp. X15-166B]|uniref:hypothetical protein n=1 Tax=Marinobacter sp. X15-166B TaxID=1897620 RepID=UPI00085BB298|nr:hypothetical protein [Marinobacter sp. X15-166B]OEY68107.1 DNA polymerase III subunit delta' [Marinobacter sp. X15-166B]
MPWLVSAWRYVEDRLAAGQLPHGLLVSGAYGVGKSRFAHQVAGLLVCEAAVRTGRSARLVACGQCKQCELVAASTHPDIRSYAPEKSKMIRVDQVRQLSEFAVGSPRVAQRKVIIVDRADQLNINAGNALLKTLEEPSADVVLLLLQETGRPVLPTLRSRCQNLALPLPDFEQARQWLAAELAALPDQEQPAEAERKRALRLAGCAPRRAHEYLTNGFLEQRREALDGFRRFMKNELTVAEAARPFRTMGLEPTLALMESWAADLARLGAGGEAVDEDAAEMLRYLARTNPPWRSHQLLDAFRESREAAVYNASPELEAERLLILWQGLMPSRRRRGAAGSG